MARPGAVMNSTSALEVSIHAVLAATIAGSVGSGSGGRFGLRRRRRLPFPRRPQSPPLRRRLLSKTRGAVATEPRPAAARQPGPSSPATPGVAATHVPSHVSHTSHSRIEVVNGRAIRQQLPRPSRCTYRGHAPQADAAQRATATCDGESLSPQCALRRTIAVAQAKSRQANKSPPMFRAYSRPNPMTAEYELRRSRGRDSKVRTGRSQPHLRRSSETHDAQPFFREN